jgi:glutamyl-tRNA reductase
VAAGAVLADLRAKMAAEREAIVQERLASMPNLSEADRAEVAAMLQEILERVVITPAERMRGIPELRRKLQNFEAIRDLFKLNQGKP